MALPIIGRKVKVYTGTPGSGTAFVGVTNKTLTINNEPVDITNDDDAGFRSLLDDPAVRSMDISAEGVLKSEGPLAQAIGASGLLSAYYIDIEGVGTVSGDFYVNGLELPSPTNDAVRYSTTFMSSGAFTFTPVTT